MEIADWAEAKWAWLTDWLGLEHGVPSHDTLGRVFDRLDPVQFETGFARWAQGMTTATAGEMVA